MTEARAEEAQRLVDWEQVDVWGMTERGLCSCVTDNSGEHLVFLYPDGSYLCLCEWGQFHSHTADLCAHALALRLAAEETM